MNLRLPDLLAAVHELPCMVQLSCCAGGTGEAAHSNQQRHGKGMSIKAHDCFVVSACRPCHRELDHGHALTKEQRRDAWDVAFERTLVALWSRGLLVVAE